jgi:hypothetical protein
MDNIQKVNRYISCSIARNVLTLIFLQIYSVQELRKQRPQVNQFALS